MRGIRAESSTESASQSGSSERTDSDSSGSSSGSSSSSSRTGETSTSGRGERVPTSSGTGVNITIPSLRDEDSEEIDVVTVDPVVSKKMTAGKGKGKQGAVMAAVAAPKPQKPRQKKPIPATEADGSTLTALVDAGQLPQGVEIKFPTSEGRPWDCPKGFVCVYESYLKNCALMFPLPKLLVEYCERRKLAVSQLTATAVCNIVGLLVLAAEAGVVLDVRFLEEITSIKANPNIPGTVYVTFKNGRLLVDGKTSKIDRWETKYFFVRLSNRTSPDPSRRMQRKWNRDFVSHPKGKASPRSEKIFAALQAIGRRRWDDIVQRVSDFLPVIQSAPWSSMENESGYVTALKARSAEKAKATTSSALPGVGAPQKKSNPPPRATAGKIPKDKAPAKVDLNKDTEVSEEDDDMVPLNRRKRKPRGESAAVTDTEAVPATGAKSGDAAVVGTDAGQQIPQPEMDSAPSQANPTQTGVGMLSDVPPLPDSAVDPQDGEGGGQDEDNDGEGASSRGCKRPSVADLVTEERATTRQRTNHYSVLCDYQGSDYIFRHGGASAALVSQISELEKPAASFRDLVFHGAYEEFASSELQHIGKKNRLISLYDDEVKALRAEVARQKTELETTKKEAEKIKETVSRVANQATAREEKMKVLQGKLEAEVAGRRKDVTVALAANNKLIADKAELEGKLKAAEEGRAELEGKLKAAEEKLVLESERLRKSRVDEVHKMELEMIRRANVRLRRIKAQVGDFIAYSDARVAEREVSGLLACLKQIEKDGVEIPEDLMAYVAKDAEELKQKLAAIKYEPMSDVIFDLGFNVPGEASVQLSGLVGDEHGSNAGLISPQAAAQLRSDVAGSSQPV